VSVCTVVLLSEKWDIQCSLELPYHMGQACYRITLSAVVSPVYVPDLILRLVKPLGGFRQPQKSRPVFRFSSRGLRRGDLK